MSELLVFFVLCLTPDIWRWSDVLAPPTALECAGFLDIWLKLIYESYNLYKLKSISPQIKSESLLRHPTMDPGFARLVLLQSYMILRWLLSFSRWRVGEVKVETNRFGGECKLGGCMSALWLTADLSTVKVKWTMKCMSTGELGCKDRRHAGVCF